MGFLSLSLTRSLGDRDEIKKMRLTGQDRINNDQGMFGESNSVMPACFADDGPCSAVRQGIQETGWVWKQGQVGIRGQGYPFGVEGEFVPQISIDKLGF